MFPAGRPELRTRYLELRSGLRVRAVECGNDDAPIVLMLPGWGCSAYVFRENLAPVAAAGFRAISVDLKGHGLSDKPGSPAEYRLDAMRAHITEILDALGADEVMLTGLSMGGALAAHIAAAEPRRVRAVIIVSPVGFSGVSGLWAIRALTPPSISPYLPMVPRRSLIELILRLVNGKLRRITQRDVEEYWAPTQFPEFSVAMRHLLHEFTWDVPFRALEIPTLMISGTRDRLTSRSDAETFQRTMPSLAHIAVHDAGHVVYDEAATIVNKAMIDFFSNAVAGRSAKSR